jgi:YNFM family putative membrane transporter
LGTAVFSLLVAAAPDWPTLLAARALEGIVLGGVPALAIAYLSEEVAPGDLGSATGLYIAGNAFGGMGGRVIDGLLTEALGWRVAIAILGAISLLAAAIFVWLLPRSRNFVARHDLTLRQHLGPLTAHLRHPALPWVFFCAFVLMGAFVSIYNYAAYRLSAPPFSLGQGAVGSVFAVYLLGVMTSAIAGRVADRVGRPPLLIFAIVLMALGLAVMWPDSLTLIIIGIGLVTVGFFAGHSTASGWVGLLAGHGKGHAAGMYLLSYYLGSSVIGTVGGLFWGAYGWSGVVAMVAVILLLGAFAVGYLTLWQRRTSK